MPTVFQDHTGRVPLGFLIQVAHDSTRTPNSPHLSSTCPVGTSMDLEKPEEMKRYSPCCMRK